MDESQAAAGARQALTVILPLRLTSAPDWPEGPLPFELGSRRMDTAARSPYFAPAAARALYGAPGRPRRWHRTLSVHHEGLRLHGLEILCAATARSPAHALAVLHFEVARPLLAVLRAISHRRESGPDPLNGPLDPAALLEGIAEVHVHRGSFAIEHPYTVAFLTPGERHIHTLRAAPDARLPPGADRWLWQLASRSTPRDFPLAPETADAQLDGAVRISADWSALVLRQSAAFLGHRADSGEGDFYDVAALRARTVYLDALLLGSLQRDHIDALTDELSEVFDSSRLSSRVARLEKSIAVFRSTYWRQHLTAHGPANELLVAFQTQHRLPARFEEILTEAADYSRLVQSQESQQISGALGILTILGLPVGTALGILQVLGDDSLSHLLTALGLAVAATAAILTTRFGRLVVSSLRGSIVTRRKG
ncbi:hypothetical protein ACFPA8_12495 [Streptomyces ovatisporus]|uniref:Uncharacterized protein n=1 Tax=Streptomyces ovatisporus TaxID=1128682 RepID=A0ABV9A7Q7_9ACTN